MCASGFLEPNSLGQYQKETKKKKRKDWAGFYNMVSPFTKEVLELN